jgi:hypothetical protein
MAELRYSVYVAPSKLVSDDLPPGEDRRMWSPTASTLIHGVRDAVCGTRFGGCAHDDGRVAGLGGLGGDPGSPSDVAGELSIDARSTVCMRHGLL